MIVSIKLSVPDKELENVQYYSKKLYELAKPSYPGHINIHFAGMQGTIKTGGKKQSKSDNGQKVGKLFS